MPVDRPPVSIADIVRRFAGMRVLVLGDMVADEYIVGQPARISREAPVLILHHADAFIRPGGATNAAYNFARLGAATRVVGIIGDDPMGIRLRETLDALGLDTGGLIVDPGRPTSTKTRIIARGQQEVQQQIVRIDRIDEREVDDSLRDRMIEATLHALDDVDALLVSDYEHGVIDDAILVACLPEARRRGLIVTVDAHGDLLRFKGVTAATPNQPEAEGTLGRSIRGQEDLLAAGRDLLEGMDAGGVLITRGSEGLALFERGEAPYLLPVTLADHTEVVDPTGAGDTVAAVFTLALTAGAPMRLAAYLGNIAGGEVVRRLGAATLTTADLLTAIGRATLPPPVE